MPVCSTLPHLVQNHSLESDTEWCSALGLKHLCTSGLATALLVCQANTKILREKWFPWQEEGWDRQEQVRDSEVKWKKVICAGVTASGWTATISLEGRIKNIWSILKYSAQSMPDCITLLEAFAVKRGFHLVVLFVLFPDITLLLGSSLWTSTKLLCLLPSLCSCPFLTSCSRFHHLILCLATKG